MNPTTTRRTFLKTTGAASAIAFPAILRAQTSGPKENASPNNRLNVAVIGAAGRGGAAVTGVRTSSRSAMSTRTV
ncbi:MAG: twin-arginine translocation signal domain-containing protein [Verrucomicrobiota bacterium]